MHKRKIFPIASHLRSMRLTTYMSINKGLAKEMTAHLYISCSHENKNMVEPHEVTRDILRDVPSNETFQTNTDSMILLSYKNVCIYTHRYALKQSKISQKILLKAFR